MRSKAKDQGDGRALGGVPLGWGRNPGSTHQVRLVVYLPLFHRDLYMPGGCLGISEP